MSWYRTGTIGVTNGSAAVSGSGTAFVGVVQAGWALVAPDGRLYEVASVVGGTALTLTTAYLGSSQSGQAYALFPTQGLTGDLVSQIQALIAATEATVNGAGQGKFANGTAAVPGIRFAADENTGLYRLAADRIGIATGGVQRVEISGSAMKVDVPITGTAIVAGSADKTAGKIVSTGWMGLGAQSLPLTADDDLYSTDLANAFYGWDSASPPQNAPGAFFANMLHFGRSASNNTQIIVRIGGDSTQSEAFIRTAIPGGENVFLPLYTGQNVLGTAVAASPANTARGAILERGSNANGSYVRFADGTQICWHSFIPTNAITVATGAGYQSLTEQVNFAAAFIAPPVATAYSDSLTSWASVRGVTNSSVLARRYSFVSDATLSAIGYIATGRWF